jgi:hypothetical protein
MWSGLPSSLHTGVKYCYVATNFITDIMMAWMRRGPYEVSGNWQHRYLSGIRFHLGANNRQNNVRNTHSGRGLGLPFPFLGVCLENSQTCAESVYRRSVRDASQWERSRSPCKLSLVLAKGQVFPVQSLQLRTGWTKIWSSSHGTGMNDIFPRRTDRLWGPPSLLSNR